MLKTDMEEYGDKAFKEAIKIINNYKKKGRRVKYKLMVVVFGGLFIMSLVLKLI